MARGVEPSSLGSFRNRVYMRGLEVERMMQTAMVTTLITAIKFTVPGSQEAQKAFKSLLDSFEKIMSLETFTESYRRKHEKGSSSEMDLLQKLGRLNK